MSACTENERHYPSFHPLLLWNIEKVHLNDDSLTDLALHYSCIVEVLLHLQHVFKDVDVLLHPRILEDPWWFLNIGKVRKKESTSRLLLIFISYYLPVWNVMVYWCVYIITSKSTNVDLACGSKSKLKN